MAGTCSLYAFHDDGWLWSTGMAIHGASGASSGDLTRALIVRHGFGSPQPLAVFTAADGVADLRQPYVEATAVALDRDGDRALFLDEAAEAGTTTTLLLDGDLAELPGALPGTTAAAVLSHDGARAFTFDAAARTVRTFDLAAPLAAGLFVEIGTGIAPVADPGAGVVLALAADERTLFVGGDTNVVVVPLP